MAVVAVVKRNHATSTSSATVEFCTATLTGTYATGGFTFNPLGIAGGIGSSPFAGSTVLDVAWRSPSGLMYVTTTTVAAGQTTATTKVFTAPGTEATAGSAVDATVPVVIWKRKI